MMINLRIQRIKRIMKITGPNKIKIKKKVKKIIQVVILAKKTHHLINQGKILIVMGHKKEIIIQERKASKIEQNRE